MVVQCPKCDKRYRVDDAQVPVGGAPVRCPSCANIFAIYREPLDIELIPVEAEVEVAAPEVEAVAPPTKVGPSRVEAPSELEIPAGVEEAPGFRAAAEVEVPEEVETPTTVEAPPEVEVPAVPAFVKPPEAVPVPDENHERARRLARALVKDIVLYHPQEVERGLSEGRLSELVGDEIRRSWKYYRERTPKEIVDGTNYFKDALNEILCKGKKVFT